MVTRKKLIEVALPLAEINDASAYDKMPGIGAHPKGMHHWWAPLPLPCARAILFASIVDDPSTSDGFSKKSSNVQNSERSRLFELMTGLMDRSRVEDTELYAAVKNEIANNFGATPPTIVDPFSGGGSIPLEAVRLGLNVVGIDLNPVAVLKSKAQVEIIPRYVNCAPISDPKKSAKLEWTGGQGLAEDTRFYGAVILDQARKIIGNLYPTEKIVTKDGSKKDVNVITWHWARTVECPNPACRLTSPLVRSFMLCAKPKKKIWIQPTIVSKRVKYSIQNGEGTPHEGTIGRTGGKCLFCRQPISLPHIREQGNLGKLGTTLLALSVEGEKGRTYLGANKHQEDAAMEAKPDKVPDTDLPPKALGFRVQGYGFKRHRDLFTARQLRTLEVLSDLVISVRERILKDIHNASMKKVKSIELISTDPQSYADAIVTFLAFSISRIADFNCSLSTWKPSGEQQMHLFTGAKVPMVWDFTEGNTLGDRSICWTNAVEITAQSIEATQLGSNTPGVVLQGDAAADLKIDGPILVSTDPPYYDNIGYSDLSDFFYIWLRRTLINIYPKLFSTVLTPKTLELIAAPERFEDPRLAKEAARNHFESGFKRVFTKLREKVDSRFPMTVYYAFKQDDDMGEEDEVKDNKITLTTGWETLLEALISTGFMITATWPLRASQKWRLRAMNSNALASYIVLTCRPRPKEAGTSVKRDFLIELRKEIKYSVSNLVNLGISPVDMAQAVIGPGMAVFSKHQSVISSDGRPLSIREALFEINKVLDATLGDEVTSFDTETLWAINWFSQYGFEENSFGEADNLARAKNTSVAALTDAKIIRAKSGKVKLIERKEISEKSAEKNIDSISVWSTTQLLVKYLEGKGEEAVGELVEKLGPRAEESRSLAYRLYSICIKKGWSEEARSYNSLIVAWSEIIIIAA